MSSTYTGQAYDVNEAPLEVTNAVITKKRIDLEWNEGDDVGGLIATSDDGFLYEGTFSYRVGADQYRARLGLYRGAGTTGAILLYGEWWEPNNPVPIPWVIQLVPKPE